MAEGTITILACPAGENITAMCRSGTYAYFGTNKGRVYSRKFSDGELLPLEWANLNAGILSMLMYSTTLYAGIERGLLLCVASGEGV
jgi:hypothetical protein